MINLEENHPSIYQELMKGNFSVQVSDDHPLGKLKPDKVIETTINRNTKNLVVQQVNFDQIFTELKGTK